MLWLVTILRILCFYVTLAMLLFSIKRAYDWINRRNLHPFDSAKSAGRSNEHSTVDEYVSQTVIDDASHQRKLLLVTCVVEEKMASSILFLGKIHIAGIVASREATESTFKWANYENQRPCLTYKKKMVSTTAFILFFNWSSFLLISNYNQIEMTKSNELKIILRHTKPRAAEKMRIIKKHIILK